MKYTSKNCVNCGEKVLRIWDTGNIPKYCNDTCATSFASKVSSVAIARLKSMFSEEYDIIRNQVKKELSKENAIQEARKILLSSW
jgi:hypothetical protein